MSWSKVKEDFQNALNSSRSKAIGTSIELNNSNRFFKSDNLTKANHSSRKLEKGDKFLFDLEEIRGYCTEEKEEFWINFLKCATSVLNDFQPNSYTELTTACKKLRKVQSNYKFNTSLAVDVHEFRATLFYFIGGIALCIIAFLAPTGIGVIALSVLASVAAVSFLISTISCYGIYKNNQFLDDVQYQSIATFVRNLDPALKEDQQSLLDSSDDNTKLSCSIA